MEQRECDEKIQLFLKPPKMAQKTSPFFVTNLLGFVCNGDKELNI